MVTLARAAIAPERIRPIRRREYEQLVEQGWFVDERVELLRGAIVEMSPQNAPHSSVIRRLTELLQPRLAGRAIVSVQCPLAATADSEPEPDVALISPELDWTEQPSTADLVIEVAETSLQEDRTVKASIYAEAGVPEYWIVNLVEGLVEVHTEPREPDYRLVTRCRRGETIPLTAFPDVTVTVDDFLPA